MLSVLILFKLHCEVHHGSLLIFAWLLNDLWILLTLLASMACCYITETFFSFLFLELSFFHIRKTFACGFAVWLFKECLILSVLCSCCHFSFFFYLAKCTTAPIWCFAVMILIYAMRVCLFWRRLVLSHEPSVGSWTWC